MAAQGNRRDLWFTCLFCPVAAWQGNEPNHADTLPCLAEPAVVREVHRAKSQMKSGKREAGRPPTFHLYFSENYFSRILRIYSSGFISGIFKGKSDNFITLGLHRCVYNVKNPPSFL